MTKQYHYGALRQIGRVKVPTSTTCARCGTAYIALAIKESDGTIKAYCAACAARIDDERTSQIRLNMEVQP